jgi:uncharacterized DUF497 family protein
LTLRFTRHAREKIAVRGINLEMIQEVLRDPQHRFYDTLRSSEVSASRVKIGRVAVTLVVVYTRRDNEHHLITVYPTKHFKEEATGKVKSGRWIIKTGGAFESQLR